MQLLADHEACMLVPLPQPLAGRAHDWGVRPTQLTQLDAENHRPAAEHGIMRAEDEYAEGEEQNARTRQNNHRQTCRDDKPSYNPAAETPRSVAHMALLPLTHHDDIVPAS